MTSVLAEAAYKTDAEAKYLPQPLAIGNMSSLAGQSIAALSVAPVLQFLQNAVPA